MELTGKCKEDFEKWYELNYEAIGLRSIDDEFYLAGFYELPETMQYGVYVDFFDSVEIYMEIIKDGVYFESFVNDEWLNTPKTRSEARTAAIEKANELYNLKQKL
jgi:hypothetical protein